MIIIRKVGQQILRAIFKVAAGAVFALVILLPVNAATSSNVSFQARVVSKDRLTAPTGSYSFRFSIHSSASGDAEVWSETYTGGNKISVRQGLFSVELGSVSALSSIDLTQEDLYLNVQFDSDNNGTFDQTFSGRIPINAVPYALTAKKIAGKNEDVFADRTENETITGNWNFQNAPVLANLSGVIHASSGVITGNASLNDLYKVTVASEGSSQILQYDGSNWVNRSLTDAGIQVTLSAGDAINISSNTVAVNYNTTNLKITSGQLNTIQDISTTSSPTFAGVGNSALTSGRVIYAGTAGVLQDSANLTFNGNQLALATSGSSGGILLGGDTNLYRSAANTLKTDDLLLVGAPSGDSIMRIQSVAGNNAILAMDNSNVEWQYLVRHTASSPADRYSIWNETTGEVATILVNGNFGLGIIDPATILHVKDDSATITLESTNDDDTKLRSYSNRTIADGGIHSIRGDWGTVASSNTVAQIDLLTGADTVNKDDGQIWFRTASGGSIGTRMKIGSAGDIIFNTATAAQPVYFGSSLDTNLYRSAADTLKTDDALIVTGHTTFEGVTSTGATGTGKLVYDGTPTLVTPVLGAATYTTLSGGNITDSGLTSGRVTYAGTAGILQDNASMTFDTTNGLKLAAGSTSALQLTSTNGAATDGILFGTDTTLYRSAANTLKTDDQLVSAFGLVSLSGNNGLTGDSTVIDTMNTGAAGGQRSRVIAVGADTSTNGNLALVTTRSDASNYYEVLRITGSTLAVSLDSATSASSALILGTDTNLYRSDANTLKTDDNLVLGGSSTTLLNSSVKLDVGGHAILRSPDSSGVVLYLNAVDASGSQFKVGSSGSTMSYGGQFAGAGNFYIGDGSQAWIFVNPSNDEVVINSDLEVTDNARILSQGNLLFYDADNSAYVGFQAPATVTSTQLWTLPAADGGAATVLKTDGSGTLYWDTDNTAGGGSGTLDDAYNNGRTITVDAGPIVFNDSGTTASLFDINQSGSITGTAALIDVVYSGSISNASDYSALSLAGVTNAGAGSSIGVNITGFDYSYQADAAFVLSSTKGGTDIDFLSKKPDESGGAFIFDTSATVSTSSLFVVKNNTSTKLTLDASGNLLPGSDAAQSLGSSGLRWQDGHFNGSVSIGSTLVLSDDAIKDTDGDLVFQADNDTTNYLTLSSDATDLTLATTDGSNLTITPAGNLQIGSTTTLTSAAVLQWGSSAFATPDTSLYRSDTNVLGISAHAVNILANDASNTAFLNLYSYYDGASGGGITTKRAKGTQASPTAVANTDYVGGFYLSGYDGASFIQSASIRGTVDGTVSTGVVPGKLSIYTANSSGTGTLALSIGSDQKLWIGSTEDTNLYRSDANLLMTDDNLAVVGKLGVGAVNSSQAGIAIQNTISGSTATTSGIRVASTLDSTTGITAGISILGSMTATAQSVYGLDILSDFTIASGYAVNGIRVVPNNVTVSSGTGTYRGIYVKDIAGTLTGTIADSYGIRLDSITSGTTGVGLYIADAKTYSIQLASTDGDAASGITFGTDTNLYRETNDRLTTDDTFRSYSGLQAVKDGGGAYVQLYSFRTDAGGGGLQTFAAKGSLASPAAVDSGHYLGNFNFTGYDGDSYEPGGAFRYRVDNTVSDGVMPTRFEIALQNSVGTLNVPLLIDSEQKFWIGVGDDESRTKDTNLYRSAANTLTTDDNFTVTGYLASAGEYINTKTSDTATDNAALTLQRKRTTGTIVQNGDTIGSLIFRGWDDGTYGAIQAAGIQAFVDGTPGANDMPGRLVFTTTPDGSVTRTEALRIDSAQKLWIGGGAGLDTNLYRYAADTLKTDDAIIVTGNLTNTPLVGSGNRAVYSTAAGILTNSSSDASLKTNVVSLSNSMDALAMVSQLRGVYYNWLDTSKLGSQREIGLIAQEVQPYIPEVIGTNSDGTLSLDYPKLTAVLIEATKQLKNQVDALQGSIHTVEEITSPTNKNLVLNPASGLTVAQGSIQITGGITVTGKSAFQDTTVAGAFTIKDPNADDYETDGTEDDSTIKTTTDKAAIAQTANYTDVTVPDQGDTEYSVVVTWQGNPEQASWVTILDQRTFRVEVANPLTSDKIFRYVLIDNN